MRTYKIIVAYDGTDYHGWQIQPDRLSISQVLQDRFKSVFKKEIKIIGASRTDAGVHALGQVAKFTVDLNLDPQILLKAWNNLLPNNILIRKIEAVDNNAEQALRGAPLFHPQKNVEEKTYFYHFVQNRPLPFISRYVYWPKFSYGSEPIDLKKLNASLEIFIGEHDFRSFCTGYQQENTIRTINSIKINNFAKFGIYQIEIKGQSFLHHMIRRIVGASFDISCSKIRSIEELKIALDKKDPHQLFTTAPAHGLMLYKIKYKQ